MVIAIIGILSSIVFSKVSDYMLSMRLVSAIDKLKDDVSFIQNAAITQHDTTWLVVDFVGNTYGLYRGPNALDRVLMIDPTTNEPAEVVLDDRYPGIEITAVNFGGGSECFFDWWGIPSSGGFVEFNAVRTAVLEPETGYVYE